MELINYFKKPHNQPLKTDLRQRFGLGAGLKFTFFPVKTAGQAVPGAGYLQRRYVFLINIDLCNYFMYTL